MAQRLPVFTCDFSSGGDGDPLDAVYNTQQVFGAGGLFLGGGGVNIEDEAEPSLTVWILGASPEGFTIPGQSSVPTFAADQYATCEVLLQNTNTPSPSVRCDSSFGNGYSVRPGSYSGTIEIVRWDTDVPTQIASASGTPVANDLMEIEAEGTTIRGGINGVSQMSVTDATYSTGQPGLSGEVGSGTTGIATADNFAAGYLGETAAIAAQAQSATVSIQANVLRPEIRVSRYEVDIGATEDTLNVTVDLNVASVTRAFARITSVTPMSAGRSTPAESTTFTDDLGVTCVLTGLTTVQLVRETTGENLDQKVYFEVWEYQGEVGGPHEFIVVERTTATITGSNTEVTFDLADQLGDAPGADVINTVFFPTGSRCAATGGNNDQLNTTLEWHASIDGTLHVKRGTGGNTVVVSFAAVAFIGSAWSVQTNVTHTFSAAGANETTAITDVGSWSNAFIVPTFRTDGQGLDDTAYNCWPGSTTSTVRFRMRSGATTGAVIVCAVVSSPLLSVEHADSITGSQTDHNSANLTTTTNLTGSPTVFNYMQTTGVIATSDCAGTGTAYPRQGWGYYLSDLDDIVFRRAYTGQAGEWAVQGIRFPDPVITAVINAVAGSADTYEPAEYQRWELNWSGGSNGSLVTNYGARSLPNLFGELDQNVSAQTVGNDSVFGIIPRGDTWIPGVSTSDVVAGTAYQVRDEYYATIKFAFPIPLTSCILFGTNNPLLIGVFVGIGVASNELQCYGVDQFANYVVHGFVFLPSNWAVGDVLKARMRAKQTASTQITAGRGGYDDFSLTLNLSAYGGEGEVGVAQWHDSTLPDGIDTPFTYGDNWSSSLATRIIVADIDAAAQSATTTFDADHIHECDIFLRANSATIKASFSHLRVLSIAAAAQSATVALDVDLLHVAAIAASASSATVDDTLDLIHTADVDAAAQAATTTFDTTLTRPADIAASAQSAVAVFDVDLIHPADVDAIVQSATASLTADRLLVASLTAAAQAATITTDLDLIHVADVVAAAQAATVALTVSFTRLADIDAQAGAATVTTDLDLIHVADITAVADAATVAITSDRLLDADISAIATAATVSITADRVLDADISAPAQAAVVTTDLDLIHVADIDAQAQAATVTTSLSVTRLASISAAAQSAMVSLDVDLIHQTDIDAQAQSATASITVDRLLDAAIAAAAQDAAVSIDVDLLHVADIASSAQAAVVSLAVSFTRLANIDAQAQAATAAIASDLIHVADLAAVAQAATVSITAAGVRDASITAQAQAATASLTADRVIPTTIDAQAGSATVTTDATVARTASISAAAQAATVATSLDLIHPADVAAAAQASVVGLDVDLIHQTDIDAVAQAATVAISAEIAQTLLTATINAQAGAATVTTSVDLIHVATLLAVAQAATVALDATVIQVEAAISAQAQAATVSITADVIHVATVDASAQSASATLQVARVRDVDIAAAAQAATAVLSADLVHTASTNAQAGSSTVSTDVDLIHVADLTASAQAATVSSTADVGVISASIAAQAGAAVTSFDVDLIHVADIGAAAGAATAALTGSFRFDATVAAAAGAASITTDLDLIHTADVGAQSQSATASIDATTIRVQAAISAAAQAATASITGAYVHEVSLTVAAQVAQVGLAVDLIHQTEIAAIAGAATVLLAGGSSNAAVINAQAGAATVQILGSFVLTASIDALAQAAVASLTADRVVVASLVAVSQAATAALTADVSNGTSIDAQAQAATVTMTGTVIRTASVGAQAGNATTDFVIGFVRSAIIDAQAGAATVLFTINRQVICDINASAGSAYVRCFDYSRASGFDFNPLAYTTVELGPETYRQEVDLEARVVTELIGTGNVVIVTGKDFEPVPSESQE